MFNPFRAALGLSNLILRLFVGVPLGAARTIGVLRKARKQQKLNLLMFLILACAVIFFILFVIWIIISLAFFLW